MPQARVFSDERKATYRNIAAADRPLESPVSAQTHAAARRYRLGRIREQLDRHDCAAILLVDPLNVRYATDVSNMALWMTHNPTNYAVICRDARCLFRLRRLRAPGRAAGHRRRVADGGGVAVPGRARPRGRDRRAVGRRDRRPAAR